MAARISNPDTMVRLSALAVLGAAILEISTGFGAVLSGTSSRHAEGLRLIKTSEDDPGTWMTEEEKHQRFVSRRSGFVDITDTLV